MASCTATANHVSTAKCQARLPIGCKLIMTRWTFGLTRTWGYAIHVLHFEKKSLVCHLPHRKLPVLPSHRIHRYVMTSIVSTSSQFLQLKSVPVLHCHCINSLSFLSVTSFPLTGCSPLHPMLHFCAAHYWWIVCFVAIPKVAQCPLTITIDRIKEMKMYERDINFDLCFSVSCDTAAFD